MCGKITMCLGDTQPPNGENNQIFDDELEICARHCKMKFSQLHYNICQGPVRLACGTLENHANS